jgi:hypothetical protein
MCFGHSDEKLGWDVDANANTFLKDNVPKAAICGNAANDHFVRIAVNFAAERECLLWV